MAKLTFFSVLKSNFKCAFCKIKNCPVRYMPQRKIVQYYTGRRYVIGCEKDWKVARKKAIMKSGFREKLANRQTECIII